MFEEKRENIRLPDKDYRQRAHIIYDMNFNERLNEKVRKIIYDFILNECSANQREFSRRANLCPVLVCRILRKRNYAAVSLENLLKVCKICKVPLSYFEEI